MKHLPWVASVVLAGARLYAGAPMTEQERDRVVAHFQMTESWLSDEVSHLSPAQLDFHSKPGTWSIRDVVEHLDIAEPGYWKALQESLKRTSHKKRDDTDADVLWYGIDRTNHQKTSPSEEPKGELTDFQSGMDAFHRLRATMLAYAKSTNDDLRGHRLLDTGTDLYQWLLEISTHSQRHILQIREIKANPAFPKS